MSYVHSPALSISTFMTLYQKRIEQSPLRAINRRQDIVRTKTIESLDSIFAFAVSRCTPHSLALIAAMDEGSDMGGASITAVTCLS